MNACLYNPPGNPVHDDAVTMAKMAKRIWEGKMRKSLVSSQAPGQEYCQVCGCATWDEGNELVVCGDGQSAGCGNATHQSCHSGISKLPDEGYWFCEYCTAKEEPLKVLAKALHQAPESEAVHRRWKRLDGLSSLALVPGTAPLLLDNADKRRVPVATTMMPAPDSPTAAAGSTPAGAAWAAPDDAEYGAVPAPRKSKKKSKKGVPPTPAQTLAMKAWRSDIDALARAVASPPPTPSKSSDGGSAEEAGAAPDTLPDPRIEQYYAMVARGIMEEAGAPLHMSLPALPITEEALPELVAGLPGVLTHAAFDALGSAEQLAAMTEPTHPALIDVLSPQLIAGVPLGDVQGRETLVKSVTEPAGAFAKTGKHVYGGIDFAHLSKRVKGCAFCLEEEFIVFAIRRHAPAYWSLRYRQYIMTRASDLLRTRSIASAECMRTKLKNSRKALRDQVEKGTADPRVGADGTEPAAFITTAPSLTVLFQQGLSTVPPELISDDALQVVASNIGFRLARWQAVVAEGVAVVPPSPIHVLPQFYAVILPGMESFIPRASIMQGATSMPKALPTRPRRAPAPRSSPKPSPAVEAPPAIPTAATAAPASASLTPTAAPAHTASPSAAPARRKKRPRGAAPAPSLAWPTPAPSDTKEYPPTWPSAAEVASATAASARTSTTTLPPLPTTPCSLDVTKDLFYRLTARWGLERIAPVMSAVLRASVDQDAGSARCAAVPDVSRAGDPHVLAASLPHAQPSFWRVQGPTPRGVGSTYPASGRVSAPAHAAQYDAAFALQGGDEEGAVDVVGPSPEADDPVLLLAEQCLQGEGPGHSGKHGPTLPALVAAPPPPAPAAKRPRRGKDTPSASAAAPPPGPSNLAKAWWQPGFGDEYLAQVTYERCVRASAVLAWAFHCSRGPEHCEKYATEVATAKAAFLSGGAAQSSTRYWAYGIACLRLVSQAGPRVLGGTQDEAHPTE